MTDTKQSELMGDVWGGLTAAIVALPLALAFGVAAFLIGRLIEGYSQ